MIKHSIGHVEWATTNLESARRFYSGLFEWNFRTFGNDYMTFRAPGHTHGGINRVAQVFPGNSPVVYVEVEKLEPYLEKSVELGGRVVQGRTELPGTGWYSLIADPDNNVVGLYEEGGTEIEVLELKR